MNYFINLKKSAAAAHGLLAEAYHDTYLSEISCCNENNLRKGWKRSNTKK